MNKDIFKLELSSIKDESIRNWTKETLLNVPDYFFIAQASSTGKYHPQCTNCVGGLLIHVKRAFYIANRLCEGWGIFNIDRDIVLSATLLHDIAKTPSMGLQSNFSDFENHPINAEKYFSTMILTEQNPLILAMDKTEKIKNCIRYHMGRWTPQSIKKEIKDYTLLELIVYTADYIATTKELITPIDNQKENIEDNQ